MILLTDVAAAVTAVLEEHLPPWLAAYDLPVPHRYDQTPDPEMLKRVAVVNLMVTVPGTAQPLSRRGDGVWDGVFRVTATITAEAGSAVPFPDGTARYAACLLQVLAQHPSMNGFASHLESPTLAIRPRGDARSTNVLGEAEVEFLLHIPGVLNEAETPTAVAPAYVLTPLVTVTV